MTTEAECAISCTKYKKWNFEEQLFAQPITDNTVSRTVSTNKNTTGNTFSIFTLEVFQPPTKQQQEKVRVYKRRFWMILLYSLCVLMNQMQWLQYTAISDVVQCYYGVNVIAVNATALVYMVTYVLMSCPASYFLDRFGMKNTVVLTSVINVSSSAIQCGAQNPNRFYVVIIAQTVGAFAQALSLSLPPRMAAIWFGPGEVSRATSVSLSTGQFGIALGFLFSMYVTPSDCGDMALIHKGRSTMTFSLLAINLVMFFLALTTFQNSPPLPPSPAEAAKSSKSNYKEHLIQLAKNRNFLKLLFCFSLENGFFLSFSTVLTDILFPFYPDASSRATFPWIGFIIVFSGLIGVLCSGYFMDYTHRYKHAAVFLTAASSLSMLGFSIVLYYDMVALQLITIAFIGCFQCAYIAVGLEFGSELTYPVPEGIMSGIMNAVGMLFGVILSFAGTMLLQTYSALTTNLLFLVVLLLACFTNAMAKEDLKRTAQNQKDLQKT